jgi:outer membrane protein OmpA-like peptidoglycan-associated protein
MKRILLVILFIPFLSFSQDSKKAKKKYDKAVSYYQINEFQRAQYSAKQAIKIDPYFSKAYLLLGQIEEDNANILEATEFYLKGLSDNDPLNAWGYFKVASLFFDLGMYNQAKENFEHFLNFENQKQDYIWKANLGLANCKFALNAIANPVDFNPQNMGSEINSQFEEYLPSISADGSMFVITRRAPFINKIVSEDFYVSFKKDSSWTPALNMGTAINTPGNEGAQCLSSDGKILFFTACDRKDGFGRCDIYVSFKTINGWTEPRNLGENINSSSWESQPSISPDGRELYFVSNRPGGIGEMDIWKSVLSPEGYFSKPVNLGTQINTEFDDMSPFIHTDNQTLYFASKGHVGMGNFDLFVSRRLHPKVSWSFPENLGYPLNTHEIENSLIVASDGTTAYYASDHSGYGKEDIFWFSLPKKHSAKQVAYLNSRVLDANLKTPLDAKIQLIDLKTGDVLMESYTTINGNGEKFTSLPANTNYALNVSRDGYLFHSENFYLSDEGAQKALYLEVLLQKIKIGNSVVLQNIFFDVNDYSLKNESYVELQKLIDFLFLNPDLKIEIEGHTDNQGSGQLNLTLSQNRSKAVYDYLIQNNILESRLSYKGFGDTKPIASNDTEQGRSKNRRTAFRIK